MKTCFACVRSRVDAIDRKGSLGHVLNCFLHALVTVAYFQSARGHFEMPCFVPQVQT